MEEKRIYSFNKIVYVIAATDCDYELRLDNKLCTYAIFPETLEVAKAIRNFGQEDLIIFNAHKFFDLYREIRKQSIALKDKLLKNN
jgi:hypothetical protein